MRKFSFSADPAGSRPRGTDFLDCSTQKLARFSRKSNFVKIGARSQKLWPFEVPR
ncbi:hypothetical protein KI387_020872, partial [Taxus chinensis]